VVGKSLGNYEILEQIGAGGMGEVYRARDVRLDRIVAVKVLPSQFAANPERRQRFEREARAISSLSHPGICTLYDLGQEGDTHFLVMEYLDGESLAQRLTRGPLPMNEVLRFGADIAEALDRAHRAGIVHRDLKPGNVMITRDGVKLLDFGLAKATDNVATTSSILGTQAATQNPADTPLTQEGTILGTFQYMAPEQLEGAEADSRSDIFAFGSVLYEMATGQKAFAGKSQASLIASILDRQPTPMSSVQPLTPPAFEHVVMKCLEKEPDRRWQSAADVSGQLRWIGQESSRAGVPKVVSTRRRSRSRLAWTLVAVLGAATVGLAALLVINRPAPPELVRFQFDLPTGARQANSPRISPDGRMVLFAYADSGASRLAVRSLDALEIRDLPGTDGARKGFWSPDSRYVGFISGGKLRKVPVAGGPSQTLADAPAGDEGTWTDSGEILFDSGSNDPIWRVSAAGGISRPAMKVDSTSTVGYGWPDALPGGRYFFFIGTGSGTEAGGGGFPLYVEDLESGKLQELGRVGSQVRYAEPGYVLSVSERTLVARPFDPKRLEFTGEPIPLAEDVGVSGLGGSDFSVSRNGTLVYRRQGERPERLVWRDSAGRPQAELGDPASYGTPAVSPDGRRVAVQRSSGDANKEDIWVLDTQRGTASRLTFLATDLQAPAWSPDGRSVVYTANLNGTWTLLRSAASGVGAPESLAVFPSWAEVTDWSRDGRHLALHTWGGETGLDVTIVDVTGQEPPATILNGSYWEGTPAFSPDGHYLAYLSQESGRSEVYVRTYPGTEGKWQISTRGGARPFWSADGRTLYFLADDRKVMATDVELDGGFRAGIPHLLFEYASPLEVGSLATWTDGERFLAAEPVEATNPEPFTVVMSWPAMLQRR
jgi:eukaryotic-like serine/threonine-protein kinase